DRVVSQKLAQTRKRLHLRHLGGGNIGLKLQQLQFDLEIVAFTDGSRLVLLFCNGHRLLKARQRLLRKLQVRIRQLSADELLADIENQGPFRVRHLKPRNRSRVPRGIQSFAPFAAPFKQIIDAHIKFLRGFQIGDREIRWIEREKESV